LKLIGQKFYPSRELKLHNKNINHKDHLTTMHFLTVTGGSIPIHRDHSLKASSTNIFYAYTEAKNQDLYNCLNPNSFASPDQTKLWPAFLILSKRSIADRKINF
jgi:hypothetical protein